VESVPRDPTVRVLTSHSRRGARRRNVPVPSYSGGGGQDAFGPEMEAKFDSFR